MAPRGPAAGGRRRTNKSAVVALSVAAAALSWCCHAAGRGFLGGASPRLPHAVPRRRRGDGAIARRAFAFDIVESDDHNGLVVKEKDGYKRVSTHGSLMYGQWNTVLGDTELPSSGRAYWEVKILEKPTEAWEYIGVAEPSSDVTQPLTRNKKAGWFWGGTWDQSFHYVNLPMKKEWNEKAKKVGPDAIAATAEATGENMKDAEFLYGEDNSKAFSGDPTHIGIEQVMYPPFDGGIVVGVDVDMDEGSVGFWADGKFLGKMKEPDGTLVNIKGKKLVPALSVFGRTTGAVKQYTVMEVRPGLEPPAKA